MAQAILEIVLKGVQDAEASVESLSAEILKQKDAQAALKKQIKDTEQAVKDESMSAKDAAKAIAGYNVQLEKSKKVQKDNTTALRQSIKIIDAQDGSLNQMRATLNKLQKEYGELDQTAEGGATAANLLRSRIQALDEAVKGQEESIGDHRRSVGDYGKALEGLGRYFPLLGANISAVTPFMGEFGSELQKFMPLLGAMGQNLGEGGRLLNGFAESGSKATKVLGNTQEAVEAMPKGLKGLKGGFLAARTGIVSATKAALAFIATPLGAVLTAIVAAVGAAIAAFSIANKRAEKEASAARQKLQTERERIESEFRAMNAALANSLIIGEAEIKVMRKGFSDAFEDLNTLFDQAGKDGGAAYGDNFAGTVETSVEEAKKITKQQFEAEKALLEEQLRLADENLASFSFESQARATETSQSAGPLSDSIAANFRRAGRVQSEAFVQAEESVKTYTDRLAELETQYKSDIAEAEALGKATVDLSNNFEESEASLAEQERKRQQRSADRKRRREEARRSEEQRLQTLKDIVNAEIERNLTEEELLEKRLNEKLKELGLDKDITKLTEQELAARTALIEKYNDDIQSIEEQRAEKLEEITRTEEEQIDKRFYDKLQELGLDKDITEMTAQELEARTELYAQYNKDLEDLRKENEENEKAAQQESLDNSIQAIEDKLAMEMLIKETAMLNELRNFQGTEEQKLALQEQFQNESLELQKDALIKQIALIESTLGDGKTNAALEQLRNSLANINFEIQEAGKEDEEPKTLADRLGLNEKQVEQINKGVAGVEAGLSAMSQLAQSRAAERMANVDQMLQQGVINEEQATRKKEQIQKEAARKQQKIDTTQAVINTAKAVTSALNSQPFLPTALIMAGIAAAQGAAQIKMIRSQKFAKGGILNGPSHAQGGIPMFSKGGAFYGEAEGGEAIMTKGVMANPALASMASAINVAGGGVPFFANGGVLDPIQSATPTDRAADIIASGLKSRQPVLVVEQLRERENSVDVIESLRTIG